MAKGVSKSASNAARSAGETSRSVILVERSTNRSIPTLYPTGVPRRESLGCVASSHLAHWHQALAYAILGRRLLGLSQQDQPDVAALARELSAEQQLSASVEALRGSGAWPVPVPSDLMVGLGSAQFLAALEGVMQAPGRPDEDIRGGFDRGGWATKALEKDPEAAQASMAGQGQTGALLFG